VTARYGFLHALYQDVLYGRLTARQQQRLHQQIGERVEQAYGERAKEIAAELALHFERGRDYHSAIRYLQQAGENAIRRSANQEAINHFTKGLELLTTLPDTPERARQELPLQIALGSPLMATKGYAAPEVRKTYARARELCQQVGETPQLFPILWGLWEFYVVGAEYKMGHELAEQCLTLAQSGQDPVLLVEAYYTLGATLFQLGEFATARGHFEEMIALYDPQQHSSYVSLYVQDPGVVSRCYAALVLWYLGYPDQALKRSREALTLARELSHPYSLGLALWVIASLHQYRREGQAAREWAEVGMVLSSDQGSSFLLAMETILQGWALAEQGQGEAGIAQLRQGMAAYRATGAELRWPYYLVLLGEAHGKMGQAEEGLTVLAEALAQVDKTGECYYKAELYRLKGQLTLQQNRERVTGNRQQGRVIDPRSLMPDAQGEAEACFLKAIEIARKQQAKSLELRATVGLARLWQSQSRKEEAHRMLAEIYSWFTEGFDTKDLQEAKALLEELKGRDGS
jgi:predicted ATPase